MRVTPRLACAALIVVCVSACGSKNPSGPSEAAATRVISIGGSLAFGPVVVGVTTPATIQISNTGTASLSITSITGPTGLTATWTSGVIPASSTQSVTIGFTPTAPGTFTGTVTVLGNFTSGTNTVPVSATVVPNVVGTWTGTLTISVAGLSNVCTQTLLITGETPPGQFVGTWQTSGGTTVSCGQGGSLVGVVSVSNVISNLSFNVVVGAVSGCTRIAGDGLFAGSLSGNNITAQTFDTLRCTGLADTNRSLTLSVNKQ